MQWIRSRMSFANVVSMIALFVALGGTATAAVLAKNSVGAKQIKKNAVRASEIKKNAVRASEIKTNAVGASEIRSNAVAGGDVADGTLDGDDVGDNALTATDILGSSLESELLPDVIARVQPNGVLLPRMPADNPNFQEQSKAIAQTNIERTAVGTYCIKGLPQQPRSAVVASDNAGASTAAQNAVVVSVAVERGNGLGGCATTPPTQVRVIATNVNPANAAAANADKAFILWMEY